MLVIPLMTSQKLKKKKLILRNPNFPLKHRLRKSQVVYKNSKFKIYKTSAENILKATMTSLEEENINL